MIPRGPTIDSGHCGTGIPPITAWLRVLVLTGNRMLDARCRDGLSFRRSVDEFSGSWVVLVCHGYSLFDYGTKVFRRDELVVRPAGCHTFSEWLRKVYFHILHSRRVNRRILIQGDVIAADRTAFLLLDPCTIPSHDCRIATGFRHRLPVGIVTLAPVRPHVVVIDQFILKA